MVGEKVISARRLVQRVTVSIDDELHPGADEYQKESHPSESLKASWKQNTT